MMIDACVCYHCVGEPALKEYVEMSAEEKYCDYCKRKSASGAIAICLSDLAEFIENSIRSEYENPENSVGYDKEGRYGYDEFMRIHDTYDLLRVIEPLEIDNDRLFWDIINSIPGEGVWCQIDPYGLAKHEEDTLSWQQFCELVKHNIRYVFFKPTLINHSDDRDPPYTRHDAILGRLSQLVDSLGLKSEIQAGRSIYRIRVHNSDDIIESEMDIGSPPANCCKYSNRMSPAGISMFYGSFREEVAMAETLDPGRTTADKYVAIGRFDAKKAIPVIDLSKNLEIPSIYNEQERDHRSGIIFLKHFVQDVTRSIEKDGREHVDYVPTQIMTEYFKYIYPLAANWKPQGIIYPSAQVKGGSSIVLFLGHEYFITEGCSSKHAENPLQFKGIEREIADAALDIVARIKAKGVREDRAFNAQLELFDDEEG